MWRFASLRSKQASQPFKNVVGSYETRLESQFLCVNQLQKNSATTFTTLHWAGELEHKNTTKQSPHPAEIRIGVYTKGTMHNDKYKGRPSTQPIHLSI